MFLPWVLCYKWYVLSPINSVLIHFFFFRTFTSDYFTCCTNIWVVQCKREVTLWSNQLFMVWQRRRIIVDFVSHWKDEPAFYVSWRRGETLQASLSNTFPKLACQNVSLQWVCKGKFVYFMTVPKYKADTGSFLCVNT